MAALNQIVINLVANAQGFVGQLRSAAQTTAQVTKQMAGQFDKAGKAIQDAGKKTDEFSSKTGKMVKDVIGNIARFTAYYLAVGQLTKFLGGAIEELRQFDENMRNIQSITLESDGRIQELGKDLLGLVLSGGSAGQSASQLAAAMYELTSAGYSSSDALKLAKISAEGAAAGLSDTDSVSKALLGVLMSYKLPVDSAGEVMNQLFTIVDKGVLHFDELVKGMSYVIPSAAALHIPIEELGAAIEMLTRGAPGQATRVFTNLNDVLTRFLKPNKALAAAIKYLGFESGAAMVKQLGLVGAIEKIGALAEAGGPKVAKDAKSIDKLKDAAGDAKEKMAKLGSAVEQADLAITNQQESIRRAKVDYQNAVAALNKLTPGTKAYKDQLEKVKRLEFNYKREENELAGVMNKKKDAMYAMKEAAEDVASAQQDLTKSQSDNNDELEDSDGLLAQWFGDVRAIRAILPLAAHSGQDFIKMLAEHNLEASSGDRHLKALAQQQKSFNYQLKMLTANLKALAVVFGAPLLALFGGWLKKINDLFKKLVVFDEESKHFMFIWEKNPDIVKKARLAFELLAIVLGAKLAPAIFSVLKHLDMLSPMLNIMKLLGPWGALALIIIGILAYFGLLDDAARLVKEKGGEAADFLKEKWGEFLHFFELGFLGGSQGGNGPLAKFATNLGRDAKQVLKTLKGLADDAMELGRLFLLGFNGGSVGGNVSGLQKFFVDAGKAAHDFIDYVLHEALPRAMAFLSDVWNGVVKQLISDFMEFKQAIVDFIQSDFAAELWADFKEGVQIWHDLVAATKPFFQLIIDNGEAIGNFAVRFAEIAAVVGALALLFLAITTPIGAAIAAILLLTVAMGWISRHTDEIKQKWEELKAKAVEIWNSMPGIITAVGPVIVAAAIFLFEQMKDNVRIAFEFIKGTIENYAQIISGVWNVIAGIWQGDFGRIWEGIKQIISGFWAEAVLIVQSGLDLITSTISNALPLFIAAVSALPGLILGALEASIPEWAKAGMNLGKSIGESMVNGVKEGLKALSKIKIKFGGYDKGPIHIPGFTLSLELLGFAKGVRDFMGGMAMVGEQGPEAVFLPRGSSVMPANRTSKMMDNMERGGGGGMTVAPTYNVQASTVDDVVRILKSNADEVGRQMRGQSSRRGAPLTGRLF